ncbi:ADP-ribosylglycohydrolase family protein [Candidatus Uabimicrobium sp. HlEnr_7]|uniref:ADP-ribosylglycohydrolase family protein n=1 Tax=Candidatus Uabimicrobium helgolandensis TaxID=3095367 RepID=UPI00355701C5
MRPTVKQYTGCLIGQCLGDALGFPVEGYPQRLCMQYIEKAINTKKILSFQPEESYPFAQYTDDSQLARELIESYVEIGLFCPENYAQRIANIFSEQRIVGKGRATQMAAEKLKQGVHWTKSATPAPSAGNGSAMRSAPIALFFYNDPKKLIKAAKDQSCITHSDPRCIAGSIIIAGVTSIVLTAKTINPEQIILQIKSWITEIDKHFAEVLQEFIGWISLTPEQACEQIIRAYLPLDHKECWDKISPYVVPSVLWSLYCFFKSPKNYLKTISMSIMMGGDVDTTAAMAGAISGAYLGIDAIPQEFSILLTDQDTWKKQELLQLAKQCYNIKHR